MNDEIGDGVGSKGEVGDDEPFDVESTRASFATGKPSVKHLLPVGLQVIKLNEPFTSLGDVEADLSLVATRMWLRKTKDEIFLHLGDVESGALED
ncbi:MAG: hypothetical protein WCD76_09415 [Pyrinomonadaceae bacterium]